MNDRTSPSTNNANPAAGSRQHDAVEEMSQGIHKGIDSASSAVHPAIDRAASGAHRAVQNADELANHAAEALEKAGVKGEELITTSTHYLREHPLLTLSVAVTAGYVLSRVLSSK